MEEGRGQSFGQDEMIPLGARNNLKYPAKNSEFYLLRDVTCNFPEKFSDMRLVQWANIYKYQILLSYESLKERSAIQRALTTTAISTFRTRKGK